jgi:hypothetical protein
MSRFRFAALASALLSAPAAGQKVPARDLFEFPLGLLADAPALSTRMTASLWNPASRSAGPGSRGEIGLAGLTTPQNQGVQLDMIGGELRIRPDLSMNMSFAQASVTDIIRTETDPQSLDGEIPYATSLFSIGLATIDHHDVVGVWSAGVATRYRWATVDQDHAGAVSLDAGVIIDKVAGTPLRVAASTFLFSPVRTQDAATYMTAVDAPIVRRDSTLVVRLGFSQAHTQARGRDDYVFSSVDRRWFNATAGFDWSTAFGDRDRRLRLGIGLRYASYVVAIGREEGAAGLGANYQFLVTRTLP